MHKSNCYASSFIDSWNSDSPSRMLSVITAKNWDPNKIVSYSSGVASWLINYLWYSTINIRNMKYPFCFNFSSLIEAKVFRKLGNIFWYFDSKFASYLTPLHSKSYWYIFCIFDIWETLRSFESRRCISISMAYSNN